MRYKYKLTTKTLRKKNTEIMQANTQTTKKNLRNTLSKHHKAALQKKHLHHDDANQHYV